VNATDGVSGVCRGRLGLALLGELGWRLSKVKNWRERGEAFGNFIAEAAEKP
jgi:hypothetical protein